MTKDKPYTGERESGFKKKPYRKPVLTEYGSIRKFTRTTTVGTMADGGTSPRTRRTCIGTISELEEHRMLLLDTAAQEKFRAAIMQRVRPGDTVVDLGTGSGLHAFFACQAGARKVYAIEAEPIIELAKAAAAENGFADRIEFIYGESRGISLPEKADAIITNIGFLGTLSCMPDAARRFLKPGGQLIPGSVQLSFVPIEAPDLHRQRIEPWTDSHFGLKFESFRSYAVNKPLADHFTPERYMSTPLRMPAIELFNALPRSFSWRAEYQASRSGIIHGLAGWYAFQLAENISMSTEPPLSLSRDIWRHPYLPLERPLAVEAGDELIVELEFHPFVNEYDPLWRWSFTRNGQLHSKQSSFDSIALSKDLLAKLQ